MGLPNPIENEIEFLNEIELKNYLSDLLKTRKKNSYFFVCTANGDGTQFTQKSFHKSEFETALTYIKNNQNKRIFIPTVLFETRERSEKQIGQISKILLDLDLYKSEKFKNVEPNKVLEDIIGRFFESGKIPISNAVTFSGGGLYLEWNLKFTPGGNTLSKRRVIMKILFEMLKEYAPDAKSLDAPHVFGLAGTTNWKYGPDAPVRTFKNELPAYTLADLSRSLPNLWDVYKVSKKIETVKERKPSKKTMEKIVSIYKEETLAHDHIVSMKQLIKARSGDMEGYRETVLFFVRNAYHKMHSKRFYDGDSSLYLESYKVALEINKMFDSPLSDEEVRNHTLNKKTLYRFTTEKIIEWFDIKLDEQIQMKVKTKDAKREKSKRQMQELKGIKKENTHEEKQKRIQKYFEENPDVSERQASKDLGIHRNTIKKYHSEN